MDTKAIPEVIDVLEGLAARIQKIIAGDVPGSVIGEACEQAAERIREIAGRPR